MKKNYLTLMMLAAAISTLTLQSFAMVPPPESLRTLKHREEAKPVDPDTTVVVSGKVAILVPTHPAGALIGEVAIMVPTHPAEALIGKVAIMVPTHPRMV
jgi:hypothetical protein